jgi:hypothetical protein
MIFFARKIMKPILRGLFIILLLGSCSTKYCELNDFGFGGGIQSQKLKKVNNSEAQLNFLSRTKKAESILKSENKQTIFIDTFEFGAIHSNDRKHNPVTSRTLKKLNNIFRPMVPVSIKGKFDKKMVSKASIFGYEGANNGMTIGFNIFMYGLIASLFFIALYKMGNYDIDGNLKQGKMLIPDGCLITFLIIVCSVNTIIGGLIFLISWLVSLS